MRRRDDGDSIVGGILARVGTGLLLASVVLKFRAASGGMAVPLGDELGIASVALLGAACMWGAAAARRVCARAKEAEAARQAESSGGSKECGVSDGKSRMT